MPEFDYISGLLPGMPYSTEAEQVVLGSALLDRDCLFRIMSALNENCFFQPVNRQIFMTISEAFALNAAVDFITVLEKTRAKVDLDPGELREYLLRICQLVPTLSNLEAYIKIVLDKHYLRSLYSAAKEIMDGVTEGKAEADMLLENAEQKIYQIRQNKDYDGLVRLDSLILSVYNEIDELSKSDHKGIRGLPTGFTGIDKLLSGLNKSDLILIAARPGVGKSSLAVNIAQSVSLKTGQTSCIFSLEMSKDQLVQRMLASESKVSLGSILTGELSKDEWIRLGVGAERLHNAPIYIDDTSSITVGKIKARLRQVPNLGLVVIDYLQLMSSGRRHDNRVNEVSEMTRELKIMAKELNVPVITLSQLSRGPEGRADKRPMLSDLRESGSIEQDADIVMFIYREDYYNKEDGEVNTAECIVAKNRHGASDTVKLHWQGKYTLFTSLEIGRDGVQN